MTDFGSSQAEGILPNWNVALLQTITVCPGVKYRFAAWTAANGGVCRVTYLIGNQGGSSTFTADTQAFAAHVDVYVAPPGVTSAVIKMYAECTLSGVGGSIRVDAVTMDIL